MTFASLNLAMLFSATWLVVPSPPAWAVEVGDPMPATSDQGFKPVFE